MSKSWRTSSGFLFTKASLYIDAGCFDQGRALIEEATGVLRKEAHSEEDFAIRLNALENLADFSKAMQFSLSGDTQNAKQLLFDLLEKSQTQEVLPRATFALGNILLDSQDQNDWKRFEPIVAEARKFNYWLADFYLRQHQVKAGHGDAAIREIAEILAANGPIQQKLTQTLLLTDVLFQMNRVENARLLISTLESDVGEKILDPQLRLHFLILSRAIWERTYEHNHDPVARIKAQTYTSAIAEAMKGV